MKERKKEQLGAITLNHFSLSCYAIYHVFKVKFDSRMRKVHFHYFGSWDKSHKFDRGCMACRNIPPTLFKDTR